MNNPVVVRRGLISVSVALAVVLALYAACLLALKVMGYSYAVVVSDSMLPTAARGDLVVVKPTETVRPKDVVHVSTRDTFGRTSPELDCSPWRMVHQRRPQPCH